MKHLFYLMGKSASGKNALYEYLIGDSSLALAPLIPWTTRPIRANEQDGVEYHFTDEDGLRALEAQGRVIEKRTYQTEHGPWTYFTVDDGAHLSEDRLGIGTLESFRKMRDYYPEGYVVPLYIEVEDGIRLGRALKRERKPGNHRYEEMCRRFLADQKDFSEENLLEAGISRRFKNEKDKESCFREAADYIRSIQADTRQN
jgi:guanylate kinase